MRAYARASARLCNVFLNGREVSTYRWMVMCVCVSSVVNRLLAKMDGVDTGDNFVVVGLTNRPGDNQSET